MAAISDFSKIMRKTTLYLIDSLRVHFFSLAKRPQNYAKLQLAHATPPGNFKIERWQTYW